MEARVKPGLSFIVGLATIIFLVRLNSQGVLGQVIDYLIAFMFKVEPTELMSAGETLMSGPELLSETILQLVLSLGAAVVLTFQGIWDFLLVVSAWVGAICKVILARLQRQPQSLVEAAPTNSAVTNMIIAALKRQEDHTNKLAKAVKSEVTKINASIATVQDDVEDLRSLITKDPSNGSY